MSFQFRVRPGELAVQLTGAAEAALPDGVAVGGIGHHAEAIFQYFGHIEDFLLTDSHSLRS